MQFLIAFGLMIISAVITQLTTKAPSTPPPPTPSALTDFQIPQIDEGTPQAVIFGDVWVTDWMVLWYGDLEALPITKNTGGGGKK